MTLRERIAQALGWTPEQTMTVSAQQLRELLRPVNAKLASLVGEEIRSGRYMLDR